MLPWYAVCVNFQTRFPRKRSVILSKFHSYSHTLADRTMIIETSWIFSCYYFPQSVFHCRFVNWHDSVRRCYCTLRDATFLRRSLEHNRAKRASEDSRCQCRSHQLLPRVLHGFLSSKCRCFSPLIADERFVLLVSFCDQSLAWQGNMYIGV